MGIAVKNNKVIVEEEDLDIYLADELKACLLEVIGKKKKKIVLDLGKVGRITTPAIQVILSAKKSTDNIEVKGLSVEIQSELKNLGVNI